jgi:hypothetical protein
VKDLGIRVCCIRLTDESMGFCGYPSDRYF